MHENELYLFICPKCKQHLAWANETANAYCKTCDKWVRLKDITEEALVKLDPQKNQMLLF